MNGPRPGRRAVLRWAWRLFRLEWRQQLLLLALLTLSVGVAVAGAAIAVNAATSPKSEFGRGGALVRVDGADPARARAAVADARRQFGDLEVIGHAAAAVPGTPQRLDVRSQDPHGRFGAGMLALRQGRYPGAPGEVALTDEAADLLAARVGDRVMLGRVERSVVGLVENPGNLDDEFALVAPNDREPHDSLTLLLRLDDAGGRVAVSRRPPGETRFQVLRGGSETGPVETGVLASTTLGMALVCLIAAAGFVVMAQRRQRQLGLLAAIGATPRHLRLVTLASGAIVGGAAALIGGGLGLVGWFVSAPAVEAAASHRIDRLDLPWVLIAECMALAVVAATAASWWPARSMARLPIMTALSARPARPAPVRRSLALALVLVAAGVGAISASNPTSEHGRPLALIAGTIAVVVGVVLASPAAVRALSLPAARLPFAARLAVRDLVRYQARAAAAVAAITLGLGISVAIVVVAKANEFRSDEGNLSSHQLVVRVGDVRTAPDPTLSPSARAALDAAVERIASTVGHPSVFALDVVKNPAVPAGSDASEPVSLARPLGAGSYRLVDFPYVATPKLLMRSGLDPAALDDATDVITTRTSAVLLIDGTTRPGPPLAGSQIVRVPGRTFTSAPSSLVTAGAMRRHGWVQARAGWLVESTSRLTSTQVRAARAAAADLGLTVEARATQDGLAALRTIASLFGALLALAIVAMTIGLLRGESVRELRTLVATGAAPRTRRTLTASTAGALAVLGVVQGTTGAYLALVAGYHAELSKLGSPPIVHLLGIAIGLPLLAATAGWLLAGREPGRSRSTSW